LIGLDIDEFHGIDRNMRLRTAIKKMVVAEVVVRYTLIDELLTEIIVRYFLKIEPGTFYYESVREAEPFRIFVHHVLGEMFLVKKLRIAHAIKAVPSDVTKIINRINAVRNALTHSFFPELRKENRAAGKVLYAGYDVRTPEGLTKLLNDADIAHEYLMERLIPL
jgi:hypothetical protein